MRRVAVVVGSFIAVILLAALIFASTFNINKYRGTIQFELEKRLGRPVTLGDMNLGMFPPRLRVQNLAISDDPRFSRDAPFIKTGELDVSVKVLPLLYKQVEIRSLELKRPNVNLIKNSEAQWNFASLGHPTESMDTGQAPQSRRTESPSTSTKPEAGKGPSTPNSSSSSNSEAFSLGELSIEDGQISLLDQAKSATPTLYDHIDIRLKNFSPSRPFSIDATARMAGSGSKGVNLTGQGGPLVEGDLAKTPFHGTVNLKQVGIADLSKFLNNPALEGTDGVMTGSTKIASDSGRVTAEGATNIQDARVRGMELGYQLSAHYDVTDDLSGDLLTIRNLTLQLGSIPLEMSGTVNEKPSPVQVDLNVRANNVAIAEAAKLAAASGIAFSQGTTVTGNLNANVQAKGEVDKPSLNGTLNASNIQMSGKDIPQPVQIQSVNLALSPSEIRSNPFNIVSGGTTINALLSLHNYTSASPIIDGTLKAPNAQLPAVLAIAKAYGVTSLDKVTGQGTLKVDIRASGPVKGVNSAEIMRALNGSVVVDFNDVKYSGANIGRELSSIAGFLNASSAVKTNEGVTNIQKITGNITVKSGIAQTNDLQAQMDIGNIGLAGTASLVTQALNMHATAVMSQSVSQKAGGQGVGGFMKTALANNNGELVIPALITGTFANPKFEPDVQQLAQMKLKGLIPNINNPASVAGRLQDLLGGPKNPAGEGQQQAQQQNPVQQLMGLFGKKKTPNK